MEDIQQFIIKLLPSFDNKVIFITFTIIILSSIGIAMGINHSLKKGIIMYWNAVLIGILLAFIINIFIFSYFTQEIFIIILICFASALVIFNVFHFIYKFSLPEVKINPKFSRVILGFWIVVSFLLISFALFNLYQILSQRPYAIKTSPEIWENMTSAEQAIVIEFDLPIKKADLTINLSTDTKGNWYFEKRVFNTDYYREIRFIPNDSFYPDNKLVIYLVGLHKIFNNKEIHEQSIEFFSPKIPSLLNSSPQENEIQIATDQPIKLYLSSANGSFLNWEIQSLPKAEFNIDVTNNNYVVFTQADTFEQDTNYVVSVYMTPRSYNILTGKTIRQGETSKISEIRFKTVSTPFIKEFIPNGTNVKYESPIKIVFDEKMDFESVQSNFKIEPNIEGTINWENESTFIFTPISELLKDTEYIVSLDTNASTMYGGQFLKPAIYKFKTLGKVVAYETAPINGSTSIDPVITNVFIKFDQQVDQQSAVDRFWISPGLDYGTHWDDNTLVIESAGHLGYDTTYSFGVKAGVKSINGLDSNIDFSFSFRTRSEIFTLGVPYYSQPYGSFVCNVVAAKMVLAYFGMYRSDDDIINGIGYSDNPNTGWVPGYGTHSWPIANYINNQGRTAAIHTGWNVAELDRAILNGHPVIIWWYNGVSQPAMAPIYLGGGTGYRGMHSEVVIGFVGNSDNPSQIITHDPWLGSYQYYNIGYFVNNWANLGYTGVEVY